MRLGLNLGHGGGGIDRETLALARAADRLGYSVCWAAEAYACDAPTVLAGAPPRTRWPGSTSSPPLRWRSPRPRDAAADPIRPYAALYLGGMGSRERNFYHALASRMGYRQAADRIQDLYLDGRPRDAAAAVPREFIEATGLIGSFERIRDRMHEYAEAGVTTLSVTPYATAAGDRLAALRTLADALDSSGLAS